MQKCTSFVQCFAYNFQTAEHMRIYAQNLKFQIYYHNGGGGLKSNLFLDNYLPKKYTLTHIAI